MRVAYKKFACSPPVRTRRRVCELRYARSYEIRSVAGGGGGHEERKTRKVGRFSVGSSVRALARAPYVGYAKKNKKRLFRTSETGRVPRQYHTSPRDARTTDIRLHVNQWRSQGG